MSSAAKTPVSYLLEHCNRTGLGHPQYDFVSRQGAWHNPTFQFRVTVRMPTGRVVWAMGTGLSKKKAKHAAAKSALDILFARQDAPNFFRPAEPSDLKAKASPAATAPLAKRVPNGLGPPPPTLDSGGASTAKPPAMQEKLNGKSGSVAVHCGGAAKSLSSPMTAPDSAPKNHAAEKGMKRKSRSPSPTVAADAAFGPTETLQRERLKRLRKDKEGLGAENGFRSGRTNGERCSARKSINPHKVSVSKVELAAVVDHAKKKKDEGCGKDSAGEPEQKVVNGAMTPPKEKDTAAPKPLDTPQKPKIDFEMEESDEEDEAESEGLKKLMENIDQELGAAPDSCEVVEKDGKNDMGNKKQKENGKKDKDEVEEKDSENEKEEEEEGGEKKDRRKKRPAPKERQGCTSDKSKRPRNGKEDLGDGTRKSADEGSDEDAEVLCVEDSSEGASVNEPDKNAEVVTANKSVDEVIDLESSVETDKITPDDADADKSCASTEGKDEAEQVTSKDKPVAEETPKDDGTEQKEKEASVEASAEDEPEAVKDGQSADEAAPEEADKTPDTVPDTSSVEAGAQETAAVKQETDTEMKPSPKDVSAAEPMEEEEVASSKSQQAVDCVPKTEKIKDEAVAEPAVKQQADRAEEIEGWRTEHSKEKVYRLTKSELENLVYSKVTEFFSDANKSQLAALRARNEQLEKCVEQWKRKGQFLQKQMTDMQNLVQRARRLAMPQRPSMRSVGLQVQLTRYIPADPSKLVSRVAQMARDVMTVNAPQPPVLASKPKVVAPKPVTTSQLTFLTNLGPQGTLAGATLLNKSNGLPLMSNVGTTATVNTILSARPQTSTYSVPAKTTTSFAQLQGAQVSLLNPRGATPMAGNFFIGSAQNVTSALGAALVKTPGTATPLVRTTFDAAKVPPASGNPVPTCLVQNHSLTNGQVTAAASTTVATTRPVSVSLVGQPAVLASGVKLIDLTADEEDAKAAQQKALVAAANAAASSAAALPTTMTMMPGTLCTTGNSTMTMLTPASTGQLLALGSAIVSSTGTLGSATPIRVTSPIRGANNAIINNSGAVRLTYLMPTSNVMTMVRPNQPVFMASSGIRPGTASLGPRQGLPTIVLQRGTATLVPLQQGQVTTMPTGRPGSIITTSSRTISTAAGPMTLVGNPTINRAATTASTGVTSYTISSTAANAMLNMGVTKTVTVPAISHLIKHPAPLPVQPKYPELPASSGRRPIPPKPNLKISKVINGIVLSWNMYMNPPPADIISFQLYAYQEGSAPPSTSLWKKVGDVKALPLPMACTLTQFMEGHKYHFAVRAVDEYNRLGPFSEPGCIALVSAASTGKPAPASAKT